MVDVAAARIADDETCGADGHQSEYARSLFEQEISPDCDLMHAKGGLLYMTAPILTRSSPDSAWRTSAVDSCTHPAQNFFDAAWRAVRGRVR